MTITTKPENLERNGSAQSGSESSAGRSSPGERNDNAPEPRSQTRLPSTAAVVLILIYIATLWVMFWYRGDKNWDRMVFLFSGYETIVFVAVGYIFGTQVQRGSVKVANEQAQQAREDLRVERNHADRAAHRKGSADALAAGLKEYARRRQSPPSPAGSTGKDWDTAARGTDATDETALAILIGLADAVLGSNEHG